VANVVREYPERRSDGSVWWVKQWDDGTYTEAPVQGGGGSTAPAVAPTAPATPPFDWSGLWGAQTDTNQQQFDWQKEIARQQIYSDLAQSLLSGAASLRGPRDWLKYAQYTQGGQDIFNRLFGNSAAPSFSAPTGFSAPVTINDVLADLGLAGAGGGAATGGGTVGDAQIQAWADALNDPAAIENDYARARAFVQQYGRLPASIAEWDSFKNAYTGQAMGATGVGQGMGTASAGAAANPMATAMQQAAAPVTGRPVPGVGPAPSIDRVDWSNLPVTDDPWQVTPDTSGRTGQPLFDVTPSPTASDEQSPYAVPLPHKINPAVWDSMSPTAQQMILASAEEGNTPSGAWDAQDFLQQLNATRPVGRAPRRTTFSWATSPSMF
jgi:hypothetical protein